MKFTKMQGCGNDYIYVDCFHEDIRNPAEAARRLSDRHFGIGSDGLILIEPSFKADFRMHMYNADGSEGEMCGNGIRCLAKYVYDKGLTDETRISVETKGGMKYLELMTEGGVVKKVRVDMGPLITRPELIPVRFGRDPVVGEEIMVLGKKYGVTCLSVGNPHAAVFVPEVDTLDLTELGPAFEHHEMFPNRINTEFIQVLDRRTIKMRVWERGSGETLACGTGACAAAAAGILNGHTECEVTVRLLGGSLDIYYDRKENKIYMTGPAETVFEGSTEELL